ncbi:MAG: ribosomal protein [Haloplasmataceae bacterium]|jgi:large subunit ribosomal protein L32|nr:ribosomal protein [Haloplasmataceae bacterium]
MAVPFRRTSKKAKRERRSHMRLEVPGMVKCSNCGELIKPHHVCSECGHYKGKEVVAVAVEASK